MIWLINFLQLLQLQMFQTEQIRRANRLWTNDSLFLRETLLVPIPSDTVSVSTCNSQSNSHSLSEASTPSETETVSSCSTNNNGLDSDNSYNDFLCKIDCSIANTRSQVMLAQGNSE